MSEKSLKFAVKPNGDIEAIYDDEMADFFAEVGQTTITRASHVEPLVSGKGWIADMSPFIEQHGLEVDNPILGPFPTRGAALAAEHEWLERKMFHA